MPNDIGKTLKKCRTDAGMTVKEISEILTKSGFKAQESTIYSWENNNSQPTPGALLKMCEAYGVPDVLSAFGYDGYNPDGTISLSESEISMIEHYRYLDSHGQRIVNTVLDIEYERCSENERRITEFRQYENIAARGGSKHLEKDELNTLMEIFNDLSKK